MNAKEILDELKPLGRESYKKTIFNHGVREPCYGVSVADLKKFEKRFKKNYQLALDLYGTGVYDAMYLAGLIADDAKMTKDDLRRWAEGAYCRPLAGATVAWVAAGGKHGWELALEWIDSKKELVAATGWATLGSLVSIKPDAELDLPTLKKLVLRVEKTIHQAPDQARNQMNGFVIAVGCYVTPLSDFAIQTGQKIGPATADLGNNACQIPFIPDYIRKVQTRGSIGKKRKSAKC
jgi:3-methyladenine DNA glycosylase AlkD